MYYNYLFSIYKYFLEFMYTLFYILYYKIISFVIKKKKENRVVFFCGYGNIPGEHTYWDHFTKKMGGSENTLINLVNKLSKTHKIIVYNNCKKQIFLKNIEYKNTKYFNYYDEYKTIIFWRLNIPLHYINMENVNKKIIWLHDGEVIQKIFNLTKKIDFVHHKIAYDYSHKSNCIIVPNNFMNKLIRKNFEYYFSYYNDIVVKKKWKLSTIPNFVKKIDIPTKKNIIIWAIPINRGLTDILINWDKITSMDNTIELHVYNNKEEEYNQNKLVFELINKYDNILYFRKLGHNEILIKISEAKYFFYPAQIIESFSIFTWECLIHHCIPIVYNVGALSTIEKYGGIVVKNNNFSEILSEWKYLLKIENYQKRIQIIKNNDFSFINPHNILQEWLTIIDEN